MRSRKTSGVIPRDASDFAEDLRSTDCPASPISRCGALTRKPISVVFSRYRTKTAVVSPTRNHARGDRNPDFGEHDIWPVLRAFRTKEIPPRRQSAWASPYSFLSGVHSRHCFWSRSPPGGNSVPRVSTPHASRQNQLPRQASSSPSAGARTTIPGRGRTSPEALHGCRELASIASACFFAVKPT